MIEKDKLLSVQYIASSPLHEEVESGYGFPIAQSSSSVPATFTKEPTFSSRLFFSYILFPRRRSQRLHRCVSYLIVQRTIALPDLFLFSYSFYLTLNPPPTHTDSLSFNFPLSPRRIFLYTFFWKLLSVAVYVVQKEALLTVQVRQRLPRLLSTRLIDALDTKSDWTFVVAMFTYWNLLWDCFLLVCITAQRESSDRQSEGHSPSSPSPPPPPEDMIPADIRWLKFMLVMSFMLIPSFPLLVEVWCRTQEIVRHNLNIRTQRQSQRQRASRLNRLVSRYSSNNSNNSNNNREKDSEGSSRR